MVLIKWGCREDCLSAARSAKRVPQRHFISAVFREPEGTLIGACFLGSVLLHEQKNERPPRQGQSKTDYRYLVL